MSTTEKNTLTRSEERQVRQEIQKRRRLIARINREFDKKFFIGDITLSDQDFEILLEAVRSSIPVIWMTVTATWILRFFL